MNKFIKYIAIMGLSVSSLSLMGQEVQVTPKQADKCCIKDTLECPYSHGVCHKKSWEVGVGGLLINWSRVSASGFVKTDRGYSYKVNINHVMGGGLLYVARELNPWLYVDLQGSMGIDREPATKDFNFLYMGGLGLQFRLTPLFKFKFVEPYFRLGINYLYKDFKTVYGGNFLNDPSKDNAANWHSKDIWNPNGSNNDAHYAIPVSVGLGINAWMTEHFGLGLQGEYLIPIEKNRPKFAQVSAKLMWRFGGSTKAPAPVIREVVEKQEVVVEKPVEKIVEKKVIINKNIYDYLKNIYFDFNKDNILPQSNSALDNIAKILKHYPNLHFLVIGHTDAVGSYKYNEKLSEDRAEAVCKALIERGIPQEQIKAVGVGKKAAILKANDSNSARKGDRKVVIEFISDMNYWNSIK